MRHHRSLPQALTAIALTAISVLGLALRIKWMLRYATPPVAWDAANYHLSALRLINDGYYAMGSGPIGLQPNAVTMPGYSIFLAAVYNGFPDMQFAAAYNLQVVISALTLVAIYFIARRIADWRAGLVAALLAAVYPPPCGTQRPNYSRRPCTWACIAWRCSSPSVLPRDRLPRGPQRSGSPPH